MPTGEFNGQWTSSLPHVGNLRAYGCTTFVYNHSVVRGDKFASRAKKGTLVRFEGNTNIYGYRVWIPQDHKVIRSTSVTFGETSCGTGLTHESPFSIAMENDQKSAAPLGGANPTAPLGGEQVGDGQDQEKIARPDLGTLDTPIPDLGSMRPQRQKTESRKAKESREYLESQGLPSKAFSFIAFTGAVLIPTPKIELDVATTFCHHHLNVAMESGEYDDSIRHPSVRILTFQNSTDFEHRSVKMGTPQTYSWLGCGWLEGHGQPTTLFEVI